MKMNKKKIGKLSLVGLFIIGIAMTSGCIGQPPEPQSGHNPIVAELIDSDKDGLADISDNCPNMANADQIDTDGDRMGDACDTDDDKDGILDTNDKCAKEPENYNGYQDNDGCPDKIQRKLLITGTIDLSDYETFGSNETRTVTVDLSFVLTPDNPTAVYTNNWCVGDEVRAEFHITINLDPSTGRVYGNGKSWLYEGTSCSTSDLESTDTFTFNINKGDSWGYDVKVWNVDESEPGDHAHFHLTFHNIELQSQIFVIF